MGKAKYLKRLTVNVNNDFLIITSLEVVRDRLDNNVPDAQE